MCFAAILFGVVCVLFGIEAQDQLETTITALNLAGFNKDEIKNDWSFYVSEYHAYIHIREWCIDTHAHIDQ